MSEPFIGEIRLFPYTYAPQGWLPCEGQQVTIQQYQALYTILGTYWGGDGKTYFNLPNLIGRGVVGEGQSPGLSNYAHAKTYGATTATLAASAANDPPHNHTLQAVTNAGSATTMTNVPGPTAALSRAMVVAGVKLTKLYGATPTSGATLHPSTLSLSTSATSVAAHNNNQPFLVLRYFIAWDGYYPEFS